MQTFPIRPEREAHILMGVSMGGSAAFAHAIKYKDRYKVALGFAPALNLRWLDCLGVYFSPFDPSCWGWLEDVRPCDVVGRPNHCIKVRFHLLFGPIAGRGHPAIAVLSRINPIELMDVHDLKPGELDMFAAYGGKDEFNIGAQVESFVYRAKERGIEVQTAFDPEGRHDYESGVKQFPAALAWLSQRVPLPASRIQSTTTDSPKQKEEKKEEKK